ncbi:MAG: type VI secretion protein [Oscillospiraceae bacterium]|nr:type VI secretion protein [Oscillospiraceae bacterium]
MDMERVRREKFLDNNARVLRAINTLRTQYVKIRDLEYGLEVEVSPAEIADSVNYLNEGGYIKLRGVEFHNEVADLADAELHTLEAKLTAKGIAFLNGKISDPCIRR